MSTPVWVLGAPLSSWVVRLSYGILCLSRALSLFCVRALRTLAVKLFFFFCFVIFTLAYHISESLPRFQSTVADTMRVPRLDWLCCSLSNNQQ